MKKPIEWNTKQLALAIYASLYGIDDLERPLDEILHRAGLSLGQWRARIDIDFPAQEGTSKSEPRIASWYEDYLKLKHLPRHDLQQMCVRYLENMRLRKG